MPNIATHYLCGLEAVKMLQNEKCRELINKHQRVFNLGTQGPDILFYYSLWPWFPKGECPQIGTIMHDAKVNPIFKEFIDYILKQNEHDKNILTVYLMGFLSHNCMDSISHPYIFYRSGFKTAAESNENLYICYHRRFETAIDVLMCEKILNKKVYEISPGHLIDVTPEERLIIGGMYEHAIQSVFKCYVPKDKISKAIRDMGSVEKVLRDPTGVKKKIVAWIDNFLFGMHLYSSIIFPLKITDGLDYLNLSHREWCMPFDKNQKSTLSFIDLFEEACKRTYRFCDVLYSSIFSENSSIPYALKLFGNRSYTSGVDCDLSIKFKYSKIIFDENK